MHSKFTNYSCFYCLKKSSKFLKTDGDSGTEIELFENCEDFYVDCWQLIFLSNNKTMDSTFAYYYLFPFLRKKR